MSPWEMMAAKQSPEYMEWLKRYGVNNPDDPRHHYNYLKAFQAETKPKKWSNLPGRDKIEDILQGRPVHNEMYMWPDAFKEVNHPFKRKLE